jgi:hypothetical protein
MFVTGAFLNLPLHDSEDALLLVDSNGIFYLARNLVSSDGFGSKEGIEWKEMQAFSRR